MGMQLHSVGGLYDPDMSTRQTRQFTRLRVRASGDFKLAVSGQPKPLPIRALSCPWVAEVGQWPTPESS